VEEDVVSPVRFGSMATHDSSDETFRRLVEELSELHAQEPEELADLAATLHDLAVDPLRPEGDGPAPALDLEGLWVRIERRHQEDARPLAAPDDEG
jgi:hypothetical protein